MIGCSLRYVDPGSDHFTDHRRRWVVAYSDTQTADIDGNFNFNLWDVFDLQRGHVVTVSDGTNSKTHTVMSLFVDGVSVTADAVFGGQIPAPMWMSGCMATVAGRPRPMARGIGPPISPA